MPTLRCIEVGESDANSPSITARGTRSFTPSPRPPARESAVGVADRSERGHQSANDNVSKEDTLNVAASARPAETMSSSLGLRGLDDRKVDINNMESSKSVSNESPKNESEATIGNGKRKIRDSVARSASPLSQQSGGESTEQRGGERPEERLSRTDPTPRKFGRKTLEAEASNCGESHGSDGEAHSSEKRALDDGVKNDSRNAKKLRQNYNSPEESKLVKDDGEIDGDGKGSEDQDLKRAMEASLEQYRSEKEKQDSEEKQQYERAVAESLKFETLRGPFKSFHSTIDRSNEVIDLLDSDDENQDGGFDGDDEFERALALSRQENLASSSAVEKLHYEPLNIYEFAEIVNFVINENGGWDKIENGNLVKEGNNEITSKSGASNGAQNQFRAQYGRMSYEGFQHILDVLQGKVKMRPQPQTTESGTEHGGNEKASNFPSKKKLEDEFTFPEPKPIKAFVDIGHGLGVQVMQAGLCLENAPIPSRGVELMENRHFIAKLLETELQNKCSRQDFSLIHLECCDFADAFASNTKKKRGLKIKNGIVHQFDQFDEQNRNISLRNFLLCKNLLPEQQSHLVVFVNNYGEVFGSRSQRTDETSLDYYLAELFANMQVGGRLVTLEDVSFYLKGDWYKLDYFEAIDQSVSWTSTKKVVIYCITKLKDKWKCNGDKCNRMNSVTDFNGRIMNKCLYCDKELSRKSLRKRTKRCQD